MTLLIFHTKPTIIRTPYWTQRLICMVHYLHFTWNTLCGANACSRVLISICSLHLRWFILCMSVLFSCIIFAYESGSEIWVFFLFIYIRWRVGVLHSANNNQYWEVNFSPSYLGIWAMLCQQGVHPLVSPFMQAHIFFISPRIVPLDSTFLLGWLGRCLLLFSQKNKSE